MSARPLALRIIALALLALAALPAATTSAHVYGPRSSATVAATRNAMALAGLQCPHVAIRRADLPGDVEGKGRRCIRGQGLVIIDRAVRSRPTVCKVVTHEFHHVDDWRARRGEEYVSPKGQRDWMHHRSKRSIMHPRPAVPRTC